MSRILTAVRFDFLLQWRFGLVAAGFVVLVTVCGLLWPLDLTQVGFAIPTFVLGNLTVTGFFFVAAMVMFEKDDGTLEALVVTPLRVGEYLASKVATLTLLAVIPDDPALAPRLLSLSLPERANGQEVDLGDVQLSATPRLTINDAGDKAAFLRSGWSDLRYRGPFFPIDR